LGRELPVRVGLGIVLRDVFFADVMVILSSAGEPIAERRSRAYIFGAKPLSHSVQPGRHCYVLFATSNVHTKPICHT
jgi:hypothetical protein